MHNSVNEIMRNNLVPSPSEMKPPKSTKTAAYQWNKEIVNSCQRIEQLHVSYLDELHTEYEQVCKECLDMVESFQVVTSFQFSFGSNIFCVGLVIERCHVISDLNASIGQ